MKEREGQRSQISNGEEVERSRNMLDFPSLEHSETKLAVILRRHQK